MELIEEKRLVARAKNDKEAFGLLYNEYYGQILGYTLKRVGDVALAEDIVSEVFFKALKNLWRFQWRNVPFSSWLYRIALNQINEYFRKAKINLSVSLEEIIEKAGFLPADPCNIEKEIIEAQDILDRENQYPDIRKKLLMLPKKYQEVITLKFFENKKIKEIAEILNKKENTVKSLLSRGLEKLRQQYLVNKEKEIFLKQPYKRETF